jgi:hypothetical protein
MKYRTPLKRRLQQAGHLSRRYRADPDYRLHKVNSSRVRRGKEPLSCVSEIGVEPHTGRFKSQCSA